MDNWETLLADVQFAPSKTKYFDRYFYSLKIDAPFARYAYLRDTNWVRANLELSISVELMNDGKSYINVYHRARKKRLAKLANVDLLIDLRSVLTTTTVASRVGTPYVTFYTNSQQEILDIVNSSAHIKQNIVLISGPTTAQHIDALESKKIIRKTNNGYRFILYVGHGRIIPQAREQMYNYLVALGDTVKVPTRLLNQLSAQAPTYYLWGGQIHTNDPDLVIFMKLICPEFIREVKEICILD